MNTTNPKPNRRRKSKSSGRKSRQKPRADDNPYYAIKDIIDEKLENDRLWYRVDWEDDPDTHQTFDPTWVCAHAKSRPPDSFADLSNV